LAIELQAMTRHRIWAIALAVLALALTLAACGEKSEDTTSSRESFSLTLDFYPNPDHAGIYMAQKLGYFEEAGLDLSIETPSDPAAPVKQVAAGRTDLAISYEPEVALAREQGLDVVAVAALVDRPLTSMIWLKGSGIKGVGSLEGKTIATAGIPYQDAFLKTILARAKLSPSDVKAVNVGLNLLPAVLSGRAQAMLGGFSNVEGIDLKLRHKHPAVTPVDQLGIPTYDELVLVANEDALGREGPRIRAFLGALARGTAALDRRPGQAIDGLLRANPDLDAGLQRAALRVTLPLFLPPRGRPFGYQDPGAWERFGAWMRENGLLRRVPDASRASTNRFLPGAGL
jgi:putative hydroxymethylpyrimidine transport system substrate-binding protein